MGAAEDLRPYGTAAEDPDPVPEPGYIPASLVWSYGAVGGSLLCPPFGLFAGIYALTRRPRHPRATALSVTAIIFSAFALLVAAVVIALEMPAA